MNTGLIYYLIGLGVILIGVIIFFTIYLWLRIKKQRDYLNESLPSFEELKPEELIVVDTYSKDNSSLPEIDEIEENATPLPSVSELLKKSNNTRGVNPFG